MRKVDRMSLSFGVLESKAKSRISSPRLPRLEGGVHVRPLMKYRFGRLAKVRRLTFLRESGRARRGRRRTASSFAWVCKERKSESDLDLRLRIQS